MSRLWSQNSHGERCAVVVDHATFLADECDDAGLRGDADHLRSAAARLVCMLREADDKDDAARASVVERNRATASLRRCSHRLNLEIEARLPFDDAVGFSTAASLALEASTRFRLQRLAPAQRALLNDVVRETEEMLRLRLAAEDAACEAHFAAHAARGRAKGLGFELRADCERAKARLLSVLDPESDAWRRVSRRIIRTRRPDVWFAQRLPQR